MTFSKNVVWRNVPGELVLFDQSTTRYYALNKMGSELWRRLALGMSTPAIVDSFASEYDAPDKTMAEVVVGFLQEALELGLITSHDAAVELK